MVGGGGVICGHKDEMSEGEFKNARACRMSLFAAIQAALESTDCPEGINDMAKRAAPEGLSNLGP